MNSKPTRILYVQRPAGGGSATGLYELVRGLDTNLYEPIVLFYKPSFYCEHFRRLGVKVVTLSEEPITVLTVASQPDFSASLSGYGKWLTKGYRVAEAVDLIARVVRLIKDEAIDLVHNNSHLSKDRYTVIAARLSGVPQVCHVRSLAKFSSFERNLAHPVNAFIYMSKATEQLYRELGIPASKGQVVYDGFDAEAFEQINHDRTAELRVEFGLNDRDWLISNVGRLDGWKGQDYFLYAMAEVIQSQPNTKALIVGAPHAAPWSQAYYQRLKQLVTDLQISEHVIFTGFRTDIPHIMAASDVLVHSSSEPEPFGRVVVEGMLAGRPVIATAAGGVLDIIENQVTGLLVPPKNAPLMAKAIQQLLQNREQARIMGQRAQQQAKERFSVEQHVTSVQCIYQKILAS